MASAFGHALASWAIGKSMSRKCFSTKVYLLGVLSSILPDIDVLMFRFGIPYEHPFGHRGFTHSILFALIWAFLLLSFHKPKVSYRRVFLFYFLATISHGLLDALTTGGRGVAFLFPYGTRYFFPWRVIEVSPMRASQFFSEWGITVLKSEAIWIAVPALALVGSVALFQRLSKSE